MKKRVLEILFVLTVLSLKLQAEQHLLLSEEIPNSSSLHFSATDYIVLLPGFQFDPTDHHYVQIDLNPFDASPPTTDIHGGPSPNDNGVVGALEGSFDVGLLGAATYSIPIKLPMGLGQMQPSLFIYYNNQKRNGLLGWGWDLGGLSAITRTGETIYHDGHTSGVNYSSDRFCLDGQRLLQVGGGDYGQNGTIYHTEEDGMSKIVSYTEYGISGPAYFKVWTADGKTYSYGTSQDSKVKFSSSNRVTKWLLKSIEDRYGNMILYHYKNEADSYYIAEIEYSGNNMLQIGTDFSVHFEYATRDDIEYSAQGAHLQKSYVLLYQILVYNKNNCMYRYSFSYQNPDPQTGYYYNLLKSIGLSAGDQHINATKITWRENNYGIPSLDYTNTTVHTHTISSAFANAIKFSGDFNGDGYTDVIAIRPDLNGYYTSQAHLFLNQGCSEELVFNHAKTFTLNPNINWIYVNDFDGDGQDDILLTNRERYGAPNPDVITSTVYLTRMDPSGHLTFLNHQLPPFIIRCDYQESLLIGDFFGEGKQSILIQALDRSDKSTEESALISYNDVSQEFQILHFSEFLSANRFYPADYNGDGATEILFKEEDGFTAIAQLTMSNGTPHYSIKFNGLPYGWDDCFPGDFNGDGVTDALFYKQSSPQRWFVKLATQTGLADDQHVLPASFPYQTPGNYFYTLDNPNETDHFITVGDFDGNGCSDIILKEDSESHNVHVYYGPIHTDGESAPFANHQILNAQRFHYFSNTDLCVGNFLGEDHPSFLGNYSLSHLPSMNISHEVKTITDGMGRNIHLKYDYLMPNPNNPSDSDFYCIHSPFASSSVKVYCTYLPFRALKTVTTYNVNDKPVTMECHYEGALLHKQGKGLLGFSKTRQEDYINKQLQKTTIRHFDFQPEDPVIHLMMTAEEVFDPNQNLMAKTEYTNMVYQNKNNNRIYIPVSNKAIYEYDADHPERLIKKEISEVTVETHCNQPFQYDNILSIVQTKHGTTDDPTIDLVSSCPFQSRTSTTYMPDDNTYWLINRPSTTTRIDHREGNYTDISHQVVYTYNTNKPHQISSITVLPNSPSDPLGRLTKKTTFQYDNTGNIVKKVVSTPNDNMAHRTETFQYGNNYGMRLITEYTNPAGQKTKYQYHPIYDHCISMTDCNKLETHYEQDPFGITKVTLHPDGTVTSQALRWRNGGYYLWEKKTGMPTRITKYTKTGDIISKSSYSLNGETVVSRIEYDDFGSIKKESAPCEEGRVPVTVWYNYDSHHRISDIQHDDGSREVMHYDGRTTSISFHSSDNVLQSESKTLNIMGWVVKSTDANGVSVLYDYYPDGKIQYSQIEGSDETKTMMAYDGIGNRTLLVDPNYGTTHSFYNAFNEMICQISPNADTTRYEYDQLGNMIRRIETSKKNHLSMTTEWQYGNEEGKAGLLLKIKSDNQTIDYEYDNLLRLKTVSELCLGEAYKTSYTYDLASRVSDIIYPSHYSIHYCYSSEGMLRSITDNVCNELWKTKETNAMGLPTRFITGDGYISDFQYHPSTNRLKAIHTLHGGEKVQDYLYEYDDFTNMTVRADLLRNITEHFTYDPLNRLTGVSDNQGESLFHYDDLGRMTSKTRWGQTVFSDAEYGESLPYAIKSAVSTHGTFPQERMDLDYTTFGKVARIQEGTNRITYQYGCDHQRIHVKEEIEGQIREKTYVNQCEFITKPNEAPIIRTFLSGPSGIFAVAESVDNNITLHYVHKDHLGSWTLVTDSNGKIEQENHFDAWGYCEHSDDLIFDRGFCGHEHIKGMNLINMNGRIYDPVTSSMLSPDNFVQMPDFTQNFNRYAYCLNNPLTYTDPSGNTIVETSLLIYFIFFTDMGYEFQKHVSPIAVHIDVHLGKHQKGVGVDVSIGFEKKFPLAYRFNLGVTYYWGYYDDSYKGWEFRVGGEWTAYGVVGYSGTTFYTKGRQQTTNAIIIGNYIGSATYENDYMFNLGENIFGVPNADNGDRYRTAAGKIRLGPISVGFNIFTGDPGLNRNQRKTFNDPDANGRLTYTLNAEGDDPDQYRAGLIYFSIGSFSIARNSEQIRHFIQNRFAHDFLCQGDSPYFKVLDRPEQTYFYYSTTTGGTLW